MKAEIAKKWVAALRSGDYKQTKGTLRDDGGFCCLGVLCNLHAQAHPAIAKRQRDADAYLGHSRSLPSEVKQWAGMRSTRGVVPGGPALDWLNDNGSRFSTIAKIIEANVKEL